MDKINIYIPKSINTRIMSDARLFEVYKSDGVTINKNKFLNMLIRGFYEDYIKEERYIHDTVLSAFDVSNFSFQEKEKVASRACRDLIKTALVPQNEKNYIKLSLKPTKESEILVEQIIFNLDIEESISGFFCGMIVNYCQKPLSERERIIFHDKYELLKVASESRHTVVFKTIWDTHTVHEVIAYDVVTGPEEMFNYFLCAENSKLNGRQETRVYRLNRIDKVNNVQGRSTINEDTLRHLKQMTKHGPQYMINDDEESCVRMTKEGLRAFNRIYYGRPQVERIEETEEGALLYFKSSKDQLFLYFRRFEGNEAVIVSPRGLKEKMLRFHKETLDKYMGEE